MELLLVRHGQTDWNLEGRYQGRSEVPLNVLGKQQAERLSIELAARPIDALYSSPLHRSWETAEAIARRHALRVQADARLVEIDQGEWEGLRAGLIAERYPELYRKWSEDPRSVRPPGGESIRQVHDRVLAAVREIAACHPGGSLCLVTHKTALVVLRCHFRGSDLREEMSRMPPNGGWESLEVELTSSADLGSLCCSAVA